MRRGVGSWPPAPRAHLDGGSDGHNDPGASGRRVRHPKEEAVPRSPAPGDVWLVTSEFKFNFKI